VIGNPRISELSLRIERKMYRIVLTMDRCILTLKEINV